jgi:hypothetical protein
MTPHADGDFELYRPRAFWSLGVDEHDDWRLKVYGITYSGESPDQRVVEAALQVARARLPQPTGSGGRKGIGFFGVHQGRTSNFAYVDWWGEEPDELHHHVWFSTIEDPASFRPARQDEPIACVWDLRVLWHERDAWVRHVLANPKAPDFEAYLLDDISGYV